METDKQEQAQEQTQEQAQEQTQAQTKEQERERQRTRNRAKVTKISLIVAIVVILVATVLQQISSFRAGTLTERLWIGNADYNAAYAVEQAPATVEKAEGCAISQVYYNVCGKNGNQLRMRFISTDLFFNGDLNQETALELHKADGSIISGYAYTFAESIWPYHGLNITFVLEETYYLPVPGEVLVVEIKNETSGIFATVSITIPEVTL